MSEVATIAATPARRVGLAVAGVIARLTVLVLAPAALAGVFFVFLVPDAEGASQGSLAARVASISERAPVAVFVALLLVFAALLHYWWSELVLRYPWLADRAPARPSRLPRSIAAWVVLLALAASIGWLLRTRAFGAYEVLSSSMLPSLEPRDFVAGNKLAYGLDLFGLRPRAPSMPRRGDVVVFANPSRVGPEKLVKRVIGLPGDEVSMRAGVPVLDGREVPMCDVGTYTYAAEGIDVRGRLVLEAPDGAPAYLTVHMPLRVPFPHAYRVQPGEVFVLGDNRNNSSDSRAWNGGRGAGLRLEAIEARAERVLVGHDRRGRIDVRRLLASIGLTHNMDGVDLREIDRGLERCARRLAPPAGG